MLDNIDVIGYKLHDGLKIIEKNYTSIIKIIETTGNSKYKAGNLNESRILKVSKPNNDNIEVIIGFF